jgi:hypothetical protein
MENLKKGDILIYKDVNNGLFHNARVMKTNKKFTHVSINFSDRFEEQVLKTEKLINFLNGGIAENNEAVSRYSLKP